MDHEIDFWKLSLFLIRGSKGREGEDSSESLAHSFILMERTRVIAIDGMDGMDGMGWVSHVMYLSHTHTHTHTYAWNLRK